MADVAVGFCHPAQWEAGFGLSLTQMILADRGKKIVEVIASHSSSFILAGRNQVADEFMNHPKRPNWLLMLDADMVFPADIIQRLLRHATPNRMVGGLCFTNERLPVLFHPETGDRILSWTPGSLVKVSGVGMACILVHRAVFERIPRDFPYFCMDAYNPQMDQDQNFCRRAQGFGTEIFVDTSTVIGHIKPYTITDADYQMPVVN